MTETEFRANHSKLIEYYQYIEMRLKSICSALQMDEEKGWFEKLDEFGYDPFGKLVQRIRSIQAEEQITLLSKEDLDCLYAMRITRNYWVHQCFVPHKEETLFDGGIVFNKGEMHRSRYAIRLLTDLRDAIEWDEKLTRLFSTYSHKKREEILKELRG